MEKALFITEKPSVAMEFVKLLNIKETKKNGFIESDKAIFTWCVGHMVTMSYPEAYDEKLKVWSLKTIPFLPKKFKYELIPSVLKQFNVVKSLMLREDIKTIYVCTDSGREGEYIYRLVDMMVGVEGKDKKRVWIDSQTEEEIKRGIKEAKPLSEYDSLADAAYLRAKEDYLLGINFSRILTLIYGKTVSNLLGEERAVIAVGRVMSCVLGMIVERELQIRNFEKTSFYKINASISIEEGLNYESEWKAIEKSKYFESPKLYNDIGFKKKEDAHILIENLKEASSDNRGIIEKISKKKEVKNPQLLFNLAELQNECSKNFKISPDKTLNIIQGLYEKKMLTYPRTDARVLSTAIAKQISKTIKKLLRHNKDEKVPEICKNILNKELYKGIIKSKYVDDKKITDHYAVIPTGEGLENYRKLEPLQREIYDLIVRRFLAIFYPAAIYSKITVETKIGEEYFFTTQKICVDRGYLDVIESNSKEEKVKNIEFINKLKKGTKVNIDDVTIKDGKTSPPKRYTSGSIIIAMENAGKLIEDDELREQIKGSGIGTSATRAEILKKLERIEYIKINNKTQTVNPTTKGEIIYRVIRFSMPSLLNPKLTASWEKGLGMVVDKEITTKIFMNKLEDYVKKNISNVVDNNRVINTNYLISDKELKVDKDKINDILGVCPLCKEGIIVKNNKGYGCTNWKEGCKFFISEICGVTIPVKEIKNLMKYGKTNIINGFKSKKGNEFNARLELKDNKVQLTFD